ncbi:copper amine oxidase N-terminal domain-containing protein [Effusibacillus lacus]|uniref:Copper amine oxidase-like N-terminal domain-containing protein n=1 Tax=Effusibacillus lacus TaxID=1348429 RepID=A0A292YQH0_9BACL|nr:copper amine oxidase N-terminal domain-containing protein [Effusibacillus lacus]TCS76820.1 copper amine oxidase-like protein [Effusibacillus lacus]GAX91151.1 hypothetical protein EFBL_2817 [Effusibacillus lacus]
MVRKKFWAAMLALAMVFSMILLPAPAKAAEQIQWGEVQKGVYDPLHPYTLLWSGDVLSQGGLNLKTMKYSSKSKEVDIVMNQYGDLGATGILELEGQDLEDPTDSDLAGYTNSVDMQQGKVYLIVLQDGSLAKIRIDRMTLPTKVYFSYVFEKQGGDNNQGSNDNQGGNQGTSGDEIPTYYFEEGSAIEISWKRYSNDSYYILYRSDNGADYVKLTDFNLYENSFVDKYALADHTYYYLIYSYDANNKYIGKVGPMRAIITKKSGSGGSGASSQIILQIGSYTARVNGVEKSLDVAPFILDGRTMVPIRFIGEALGAQIDYNAAEQRVTLTQNNGNTIMLWIDKSEASVNGKTVYMDVPAKVINGRTMVPIRFVSENFNQTVSFDSATQTITISGQGGSVPQNNGNNSSNNGVNTIDLSFFYGTWSLWTPGAAVGGQYSPGANAGYITIKSDGTYEWSSVLDGDLTGEWKKTGKSSEIMIMNGESEDNWTARKQDDGTIMVFDSVGVYHIGTRVTN